MKWLQNLPAMTWTSSWNMLARYLRCRFMLNYITVLACGSQSLCAPQSAVQWYSIWSNPPVVLDSIIATPIALMATSTATCKANESVIPGFYKIGYDRNAMAKHENLSTPVTSNGSATVRSWCQGSANGWILGKVTTAVVSQEMALKPLWSSWNIYFFNITKIYLGFPWHREVFQSTPPPSSLFNHLCFFTSLQR